MPAATTRFTDTRRVEEDFYAYLHWLGEALRETACVLHAYTLMTNHVHLLLTTSGDKTKSEELGLGDHEFVPWQIGITG